MKCLKIILIIILSAGALHSQFKVTYGIRNNGEEIKNDSIVIYCNDKSVRITRPALTKELQFIDIENSQTVQMLKTEEHEFYSFRKGYEDKFPPVVAYTDNILGYNCMKTSMMIRSNTIEVWFTDNAEFRGAPGLYLAGIPGIVMKVIRNGNYEIYAKSIEKSADFTDKALIPTANISQIDEAEFQMRLIAGRYKTFNVFEKEILNFSETYKKDLAKEVVKFSKGTVAVKRVDLPPAGKNTIVIAELTVRSNGDAYDRTGSVFAIRQAEGQSFLDGFTDGIKSLPEYKDSKWNGIALTDNYEPAVEIIRFITSFGAGHFSNDIKIKDLSFRDSITYRQDVSDIIKGLGSTAYIGIFIGNWDKGGHEASLRLKYFEEDEFDNDIKWIQPLFNTVNLMETEGQDYPNLFKTDTLSVKIRIPEGLNKIKMRFLTTGHGNDEFIPRLHKILSDGKEVFSLVPWRTDCGTYRENNPSSGNFLNGMSSSDYSRSNWCPGMVVNPYEIRLEGITAGNHTISVIIECGDNSYWNVSGCLLGE